jgi:hypothetical protein
MTREVVLVFARGALYLFRTKTPKNTVLNVAESCFIVLHTAVSPKCGRSTQKFIFYITEIKLLVHYIHELINGVANFKQFKHYTCGSHNNY